MLLMGRASPRGHELGVNAQGHLVCRAHRVDKPHAGGLALGERTVVLTHALLEGKAKRVSVGKGGDD